MRSRTILAAVLGIAVVAVPGTSMAAVTNGQARPLPGTSVGRQVLAPSDGWASSGAGTTGGSAAAEDQVSVVSSREELVAALGGDNVTNRTNATAKIIYIDGVIDGLEGPDGTAMGCLDLADPEYSLDQYLATYDPAVWDMVAPSGQLEQARVRSVATRLARHKSTSARTPRSSVCMALSSKN